MGPQSPPSFPVSLPEAECLEPRRLIWGEQNATFSPGLPWQPCGPSNAHPAGRGSGPLCREEQCGPGTCTGSEASQRGGWCISGRAGLSLPFTPSRLEVLTSPGMPAHCPVFPGRHRRLIGEPLPRASLARLACHQGSPPTQEGPEASSSLGCSTDSPKPQGSGSFSRPASAALHSPHSLFSESPPQASFHRQCTPC